jgi:hypothetical protein
MEVQSLKMRLGRGSKLPRLFQATGSQVQRNLGFGLAMGGIS